MKLQQLISLFIFTLYFIKECRSEESIGALSSESVVLITGAATHLGSQLAISLYRTYNVSKLILIDELGANDIYLPPNNLQTTNENFQQVPNEKERTRSEKSISVFETKRQRIFHVMQTVQDRGYFYKVDFRPVFPQYSETQTDTLGSYRNLGLPILDMIFQKFRISHIAHMDDNILNPNATQIVPRRRQDNRMGMMEGLLEQIRHYQARGNAMPRFVYGSTAEIYTEATEEKREDVDIAFGPDLSSKGISKLLDERLARLYSELYGIQSVGLRFGDVYGPFAESSIVHDIIRRSMDPLSSIDEIELDASSLYDFVYIDDAIDAIMAALQLDFPARKDIVVNVGSGSSSSINDLIDIVESHSGSRDGSRKNVAQNNEEPGLSLDRARYLLNFEPRYSFKDGILHTLAWYNDETNNQKKMSDEVTRRSAQVCNPLDTECLNGLSIYPCLSECSRLNICFPSEFDNVAIISRAITSQCEAIVYTTLTNNESDAFELPFTSDQSQKNGGACNVAFVEEDGRFLYSLKTSLGIDTSMNYEDHILAELDSGVHASDLNLIKYGNWIVLPFTANKKGTINLPKWSPSSFFTSKYATYIHPSSKITLSEIHNLIDEAKAENIKTSVTTAMIMAGKDYPRIKTEITSSLTQERMYNSIRIIVQKHNNRRLLPDTSWILHVLETDTAKDLRCHIYEEMMKWDAIDDKEAVEYAFTMNEFWNTVFSHWKGQPKWWMAKELFGENVGIVSKDEKTVVKILSY